MKDLITVTPESAPGVVIALQPYTKAPKTNDAPQGYTLLLDGEPATGVAITGGKHVPSYTYLTIGGQLYYMAARFEAGTKLVTVKPKQEQAPTETKQDPKPEQKSSKDKK